MVLIRISHVVHDHFHGILFFTAMTLGLSGMDRFMDRCCIRMCGHRFGCRVG